MLVAMGVSMVSMVSMAKGMIEEEEGGEIEGGMIEEEEEGGEIEGEVEVEREIVTCSMMTLTAAVGERVLTITTMDPEGCPLDRYVLYF